MAYRRVCPAFRIVSAEAGYVLSGMIPIYILADEMTNIYNLSFIAVGERRREEICKYAPGALAMLGKGPDTQANVYY